MIRLQRRWLVAPAGLVAVLWRPEVASACSACFGDPDSDMAKGAVAGVWVLAGVIYSLLMCFGGFIGFCVIRARRLDNPEIPQ